MKYLGFPIYFWIAVVLFIVFGNYILKTTYGFIYKVVTGNDIDSSYYQTNRYGTRDYAYDFGKAIFRV
jgi:hypothetical protein